MRCRGGYVFRASRLARNSLPYTEQYPTGRIPIMETTNTPRLVRALRKAYDQKKGRTELEGAEAGFTLIELMVVLLIMAILLAIAIPTFLGVKGGAQDRAVQSNLTNALISAKSTYATNSSYLQGASMIAVLSAQEPSLTFVA